MVSKQSSNTTQIMRLDHQSTQIIRRGTQQSDSTQMMRGGDGDMTEFTKLDGEEDFISRRGTVKDSSFRGSIRMPP